MILSAQSIARRIISGDLSIEPLPDYSVEVRGLFYGSDRPAATSASTSRASGCFKLLPGDFELAVAINKISLLPDLATMASMRKTMSRLIDRVLNGKPALTHGWCWRWKCFYGRQ